MANVHVHVVWPDVHGEVVLKFIEHTCQSPNVVACVLCGKRSKIL